MSDLMERAFDRLRSLPENRQDELAPMVMMLAETEAEPYRLSADERAAVERSQAAFEGGDVATDEQVRAVWAKHGL